MFRLENENSFLEIQLLGVDATIFPNPGDVRLSVLVESAAFRGQHELTILGSDFDSFRSSILLLIESRTGAAYLSSVFNEELVISIRSISSLGHMCVEGSLGFHVQEERGRHWNGINFGFEFEPTQLTKLEQIPWIREMPTPTKNNE